MHSDENPFQKGKRPIRFKRSSILIDQLAFTHFFIFHQANQSYRLCISLSLIIRFLMWRRTQKRCFKKETRKYSFVLDLALMWACAFQVWRKNGMIQWGCARLCSLFVSPLVLCHEGWREEEEERNKEKKIVPETYSAGFFHALFSLREK